MVPVLIAVFILFSGYLVPAAGITPALRWLNTIGMLTRPLKGLAINEMDGLTFHCTQDELLPPLSDPALNKSAAEGGYNGVSVGQNERYCAVLYCNPPNRKRNETHETLVARARRCAPPYLPARVGQYKYRACPMVTGKMSLQIYGYTDGTQDIWLLLLQNASYLFLFQLLIALVIHTVDWSNTSTDDPAATAKKPAAVPSEDGGSVGVHTTGGGGGGGEYQQLRDYAGEGDGGDDDEDNDEDEEEKGGEKKVSASSSSSSASPFAFPSGGDDSEVRRMVDGSLEFRDLSYYVPIPSKEGRCHGPAQLQLLYGISGYALPGECVALMGASGAGKTTLLDVIANKKTGGTITGSIKVSGRDRDAIFPRMTGYVEQMDSHIPTQTVEDALWTSARLRLPASMSDKEKQARVDDAIRELGLLPFRAQLIGTPGTMGAVSPEVRKKVTIGVELVADPAVLFLDEPTTGLDSNSALSVMALVKRVCRKRRKAVVCTIHQPALEVFTLFDSILLLQKGGRVAFFGPIAAMEEYFTGQGFERCADGMNPADYALTCSRRTFAGAEAMGMDAGRDTGGKEQKSGNNGSSASASASTAAANNNNNNISSNNNNGNNGNSRSGSEVTRKATLQELRAMAAERGGKGAEIAAAPMYEASEWREEVLSHSPSAAVEVARARARESGGAAAATSLDLIPSPDFDEAYASSLFEQLSETWSIQLRYHYRDLSILKTRFAVPVVFAFILGLLFFQLEMDQDGAKNRISAVFITCVYTGSVSAFCIPKIVAQRAVYFRESSSNTYRLLPSFLSTFFSELPFVLVQAVLYLTPMYFLVGLRPGIEYFLPFMGCYLVLSVSMFAFAHFLAAAAPNSDTATILMMLFNSIFTLFCGFLLPYAQIPGFWRPLYYLSMFRYPLGYMVSNQVGFALLVRAKRSVAAGVKREHAGVGCRGGAKRRACARGVVEFPGPILLRSALFWGVM